MIDVVLKPVEREVFRSKLVLLAEYHCRPDEPLFANSGPSNAHSFVFPLTSTRIIRDARIQLELPNVVSLYNAGVHYASEPVSPEGSHCMWMTLDPEILIHSIESCGRRSVDPHRPFRDVEVSLGAAFALRQSSLFHFARRYGSDSLAIEEESIAIVQEIIDGLERRPARSAHYSRVIDRARAILAAHFADPWSLGDLACQLGVTPSHLSRAFRAATGQTLHTFREQLRLRRALELLPRCRRDFTRVALDLGYSSHSHFSDRFRRCFGVTPIEFVANSR
jgi:AraC family transcriptional regulator